jgi:hypothetical protein
MSKEVNKNYKYKAHPPCLMLFCKIKSTLIFIQNGIKRGGCALNKPFLAVFLASFLDNRANWGESNAS